MRINWLKGLHSFLWRILNGTHHIYPQNKCDSIKSYSGRDILMGIVELASITHGQIYIVYHRHRVAHRRKKRDDKNTAWIEAKVRMPCRDFSFKKKKKRWVRASPRKRTGRVWSACLFTLCALAVRLYVTSIRPCRPTALPCLPPPKNVCCSSRLAGLPHPFWVLVLIINLITRWTWSVRRH